LKYAGKCYVTPIHITCMGYTRGGIKCLRGVYIYIHPLFSLGHGSLGESSGLATMQLDSRPDTRYD
jgi:hypothetical protein